MRRQVCLAVAAPAGALPTPPTVLPVTAQPWSGVGDSSRTPSPARLPEARRVPETARAQRGAPRPQHSPGRQERPRGHSRSVCSWARCCERKPSPRLHLANCCIASWPAHAVRPAGAPESRAWGGGGGGGSAAVQQDWQPWGPCTPLTPRPFTPGWGGVGSHAPPPHQGCASSREWEQDEGGRRGARGAPRGNSAQGGGQTPGPGLGPLTVQLHRAEGLVLQLQLREHHGVGLEVGAQHPVLQHAQGWGTGAVGRGRRASQPRAPRPCARPCPPVPQAGLPVVGGQQHPGVTLPRCPHGTECQPPAHYRGAWGPRRA